MDQGFIVLLPVIVVLVCAVTTRRTLLSLFLGSLSGVIILGGGDFFNTWIEYFNIVMSDSSVIWLLLVIASFGVLVVLFENSGAVSEFGIWIEKFINTRKKTLLSTFLLGIVIFLDDYLSNLTVGTTMKNMTDKYNIPRSKLGYIANSTAAPVCLLVPISTWAVFFGGLLEGANVTYNGSGLGAYIKGIPYMAYGWAALIVAFLVAMDIIPSLGAMKEHEELAKKGQLFPNGDIYKEKIEALNKKRISESEEVRTNANPIFFLLPILVMVIVTIVSGIDVLKGTTAALVVSFFLYVLTKKISVGELFEYIFEGINSMFFVYILTILAFMIQNMNIDLQLAEYIMGFALPIIKPNFLPAIVFVVCAIYAYATGCFWDLAAIVIPIFVPLAIEMNVDPIIAASAIFSAATFGSTTCLYGDGVILAAQSSEVEPVDLMLASLPYALIAAFITTVFYLIIGFVM